MRTGDTGFILKGVVWFYPLESEEPILTAPVNTESGGDIVALLTIVKCVNAIAVSIPERAQESAAVIDIYQKTIGNFVQ